MLAHRGLALDVPENTPAAFAAATAVGVQYVETDVHLSRDGVAVVAHDPALDRVAARTESVADLTMDELRAVDLGAGHGFAPLDEVLDAFPTLRFNVDVKVEAAVEATVDAVRRTAAADRVLLTSFSDARRRRLASLVPGVATSAGRGGVIRAWAASLLGGRAMMRWALAGADATQVPERVGPLPLVSRRFVERVHTAGAEVHVWTVNDPVDMGRLLDLGVDGLVTDRCDLALPLIRARS
ncbi:glycerophosphodiester phosphodiesterase family protein [Agromyces agglutinans]|uniref:glycerophosphodiester phosphodiesterase family protein n=1 Tax=Agromyces agglutinans TaxID=2662258 RepID=UPI0028ACDF33|nr:glycerophosphodiester phosphodiesterase family protein [Agromyces agglutinans]